MTDNRRRTERNPSPQAPLYPSYGLPVNSHWSVVISQLICPCSPLPRLQACRHLSFPVCFFIRCWTLDVRCSMFLFLVSGVMGFALPTPPFQYLPSSALPILRQAPCPMLPWLTSDFRLLTSVLPRPLTSVYYPLSQIHRFPAFKPPTFLLCLNFSDPLIYFSKYVIHLI
jgi:hypothetical protein